MPSETRVRHGGSYRVSLPRFIILTTSVFLVVGLGAQMASAITGRTECLRSFLDGTGALLAVTLAVFEFSLARLVVRQFSEGEPLRPAWFLMMLAGGCQLVGSLCVEVLSAGTPLNPLAYGQGTWSDSMADAICRFGLIVQGPVQFVLLASGLFFLLRLCRESRIAPRGNWLDWGLLLLAVARACGDISHLAGGAGSLTGYDILQALHGPLLVILVIEAILVRRFMCSLGGGMIAKCWSSITAAIFLSTLCNMSMFAPANAMLPVPLAAITWYIWLLSATAYALGPAWQIEAIQSACGEIGAAGFSPVASSLEALRLINRTS
jgi:hypothetical protein